MRIDASGNLGLGVTPSAWSSTAGGTKAFQIGNGTINGFIAAKDTNEIIVGANAFRDGANWKYVANGASTFYDQANGAHLWFNAPSGTAGNAISFTQAMTLDASGNLGIGTSSPVSSSGTTALTIYNGTTAAALYLQNVTTGTASSDGATLQMVDADLTLTNRESGYIRFSTDATERARINSSGNLLVGTTSAVNNWNNSLIKMRIANGIQFGDYSAIAEDLFDADSLGICYDSTENLCFGQYTSATTTYTERARITSGGYFKASSTGSYISSTGTYHEFRTDNSGLYVSTASGSQTSDNIVSRSARAANSAYRFFAGESSDGSDVEFNLRGDGNGYADGTWNNNGADYAEYFESANGEALTLGATVVLDGNKVREATAQDPASAIIGVVRPKEPSKASMVVGNTAWNKWANKYLTDDFDRYIMEDHDVVEWEEQALEKEATEAVVDEEGNEVSPAQEATYKTIKHSYESHNIPEGITVPEDATVKTHDDKNNKFQHYKLNPAWDKDSEYTPREQRPEWNIIGMVGQVKVLKGQPTNDRWVKMRDVSANVEEWFIR
jgi:hypothetical protein